MVFGEEALGVETQTAEERAREDRRGTAGASAAHCLAGVLQRLCATACSPAALSLSQCVPSVPLWTTSPCLHRSTHYARARGKGRAPLGLPCPASQPAGFCHNTTATTGRVVLMPPHGLRRPPAPAGRGVSLYSHQRALPSHNNKSTCISQGKVTTTPAGCRPDVADAAPAPSRRSCRNAPTPINRTNRRCG